MAIREVAQASPGVMWVLGRWHIAEEIRLVLLPIIDRAPRPDLDDDQPWNEAKVWLSYHAARKYQKEHERELSGYRVMNLSEILSLAEAAEERRHRTSWYAEKEKEADSA